MILFDTTAVTEVMQRQSEHGKIRGTDESEEMWEKDATAYFWAPSGILLGRMTKSVNISDQAVNRHPGFELLYLRNENQTRSTDEPAQLGVM
jgi:hypothetical protein